MAHCQYQCDPQENIQGTSPPGSGGHRPYGYHYNKGDDFALSPVKSLTAPYDVKTTRNKTIYIANITIQKPIINLGRLGTGNDQSAHHKNALGLARIVFRKYITLSVKFLNL